MGCYREEREEVWISSWVMGKVGRGDRGLDHFFFQAEDGIRDFCLSRGLGDVYERKHSRCAPQSAAVMQGSPFAPAPRSIQRRPTNDHLHASLDRQSPLTLQLSAHTPALLQRWSVGHMPSLVQAPERQAASSHTSPALQSAVSVQAVRATLMTLPV